jgi:hypothetical protein
MICFIFSLHCVVFLSQEIGLPADQCIAAFVCVLGRLLYRDSTSFFNLFTAAAAHITATTGTHCDPSVLLNHFLTVVDLKYECIVEEWKKRILLLGLIKLLSTGNPVVLNWISSLISCVNSAEAMFRSPDLYKNNET